jgi:cytochrome c oxidase assembly factor CtaG
VGPYAWDAHLAVWLAIVVGIVLVVGGHRRLVRTDRPPIPWTRHQIVLFVGACVCSVIALTWPLADLAAHWSLIALVTQRLLLLVAVAPLLLLGLPYDVIRWLTRPAPVDAVLVHLERPLVALVLVTTVAIGSMTPVMVHAQSTSPLARGVLDLAVLAAGMVLWLPVLGRIPGYTRPQPAIRFGYLVSQAVLPAFLSFIFIFSTRPLYPEFARSHAATGLRPLNDQQVAGFVSKLTMLFVLLIVGAVVLARAPRSDEELDAKEPLVWADVEREFERVDRQGTKEGSDGGRHPAGPEQGSASGSVP